MHAYILAFILTFWPAFARHPYQVREVSAVVDDIVSTDASPGEALRLANVAALESGFRRDAVGTHGERGAFQIMPPARSFGAREALHRMRLQGMIAYVGCRRADDEVLIRGERLTCASMVAHRVDRADLFRMAFDPPDGPSEREARDEHPRPAARHGERLTIGLSSSAHTRRPRSSRSSGRTCPHVGLCSVQNESDSRIETSRALSSLLDIGHRAKLG